MATPSPTAPAVSPASLRQDARTIGLIGLAHGSSHFFHLMLPPLFPVFFREFGFSYTDLGLLVTTFFVVSGVGQALSGFLVDRVGARPVLFIALSCFAAAALVTATATGYAGLALGAVLAGLGNAPFHPVDFTILNKRVSKPRLGHAFSVHGISGNLGWAAAPAFLTGITALTGSWRIASGAMAAWALLVMALMWWNRDAIDDKSVGWDHDAKAVHPGAPVAPPGHPMAFLKLPSVWLCFSFFFFLTCALCAVQNSAGLALGRLYPDLPEWVPPMLVTGYMLSGAAGMVVGGFVAVRADRLERIIGVCLVASALFFAVVGTGWLPAFLATLLAAAAGFGTGVAGPSRDLLIKQASPPGATGRVYGTVYSGLDLGFAVAAPLFGAMIDRNISGGVFYGAAVALLMGVVSASFVGVGVALAKRQKAALLAVKVPA